MNWTFQSVSIGVFVSRIILGSPEQGRHSLLLHSLGLAFAAAELGQDAENEMEENAEDKRSAGEDRDGDVLDGYRQGGKELRRFGAAHGCSNDVCAFAWLALAWISVE